MELRARNMLLNVIRNLLRKGVYPARHPLIRGLWSHEWRWFLDSYYDAEIRFLLSLRLQGQVVYDVGANAGLMTLFFARAVGSSGHVVAFEPDPVAFERLCRNVKLNRFTWVRFMNCALGSQSGTLSLFVPSRSQTVSTLVREHALTWQETRGEEIAESYPVRVEKMDDVIASLQLPPPDFVKIDVESYELEVLRGSQETIRAHRPRLFIELHGHTVPFGKQLVQDVLDFVFRFEYRVRHVESDQMVSSTDVDFLNGHIYCTEN